MKHSESIKNLAEALAKAQAEMPVVQFNNVNPFLKNKFADLGAVISASRPVLQKYSLALTQFPASDGGYIGITSLLTHASGEWLEDTIMLMPDEEKGKSGAQVAGSIITYLRRYAWSSILGLHADEDVDGNATKTVAKEPVNEQPKDQRIWSMAQKEALINAGLARDDFAAKGMLGLSNLFDNASPETIVKWGKAYRDVRPLKPAKDSPSSSEAAARANQLYKDGAL